MSTLVTQAESLSSLAAQFEQVVAEGKTLGVPKVMVDGATKFDRCRAGLAQYARNVLSGISMAKIELALKEKGQ